MRWLEDVCTMLQAFIIFVIGLCERYGNHHHPAYICYMHVYLFRVWSGKMCKRCTYNMSEVKTLNLNRFKYFRILSHHRKGKRRLFMVKVRPLHVKTHTHIHMPCKNTARLARRRSIWRGSNLWPNIHFVSKRIRRATALRHMYIYIYISSLFPLAIRLFWIAVCVLCLISWAAFPWTCWWSNSSSAQSFIN